MKPSKARNLPSRPVKARSPASRARAGAAGRSLLFPGMEPANRGIALALTASILIHAIVLSIHFKLPERLLQKARDTQLEVILVNSKRAAKPVDPQALAQANLDGGGNTDENRRAKTPLPPNRTAIEGSDLIEAQRRVQELEQRQQQLLTRMKSEAAVQADPKLTEQQPELPAPITGADLAHNALAMARLEAQIARQVDEYNKRPRKKFVGTRTTEAAEAQYVEDWRQKVERVGNLNYPAAARGKIYGSLVLSVSIRADGEVDSIDIHRSSGHRVLDDAARRIVEMAGPFGAFPDNLRRSVDILVISRTWTFTTTDRLASD